MLLHTFKPYQIGVRYRFDHEIFSDTDFIFQPSTLRLENAFNFTTN